MLTRLDTLRKYFKELSNGDYIYVLEMMIQTIDGMMNEPIGAFTTDDEAQKWRKLLKRVYRRYRCQYIPVKLDENHQS